ncbi:MAG: hypothetical protein ACO22D_01415 [Schleiferiaceae bacterium]
MGIKYFAALSAAILLHFGALAQTPARWALVLPFQVQPDTSGGKVSQRMALEFYAGFKAALDSAAGADGGVVLDLYDFDEATGAVVERELGGLSHSYSPKDFMELQGQRGVRFVVGPFRGQDSEALARHAAPSTFVVNPVSRDVSVQNLPQMMAAAPPRFTESEALGRLAARDAKARPNSRTVVFDLGDKNSALQRKAFYSGFAANGGDTTKIQSWDGRPTANLAERVGREDLIATRFVLLDDKVLSAARILQGLRQRPASQTELWTVSTTVNSPSLDAFLLLRQPIIWVQTDRLEFAAYDAVDAQISQALGESRSRWAWLGYDTALMLLANEPDGFTGPRRRYEWSATPSSGLVNRAVELYRYDPKVGVNPISLPALP